MRGLILRTSLWFNHEYVWDSNAGMIPPCCQRGATTTIIRSRGGWGLPPDPAAGGQPLAEHPVEVRHGDAGSLVVDRPRVVPDWEVVGAVESDDEHGACRGGRDGAADRDAARRGLRPERS